MKEFSKNFPDVKRPLYDWERDGYNYAKEFPKCWDIKHLKEECSKRKDFGRCVDKYVESKFDSMGNDMMEKTREGLVLEQGQFLIDDADLVNSYTNNRMMWTYGYEKYIVDLYKSGDCE